MGAVIERQLAPSWDGSVVLDIGGDVGALMLCTTPHWNGREIDLIPDDSTLPHTHSAVRERRSASGVSYAAVYPQLREGTYTIEGSQQRVVITGGNVSTLDLQNEMMSTTAHRHEHVHAAHDESNGRTQ